jgi:hypothetical protein
VSRGAVCASTDGWLQPQQPTVVRASALSVRRPFDRLNNRTVVIGREPCSHPAHRPSWTASYSSGLECDVEEFGGGFSVLEAVGNHPEREGLHAGDSFITVGAVAQNAGESWHFAIQRPSSSRSISIEKTTVRTVPSRLAV